MNIQNKGAFTLVELIVVITILAVLATVAFISFQWYTSSSRDSVRLADLKNISKSFGINRTKGIDFPLPDKKVDISASGTVFQYQWELSQNILNSDLNIFDGWVDPLTGDNYWYAVNFARNKFQLVWFLENQESVANISATQMFADNTDKYVKSIWDTLGILLNEINNEIITDDNEILDIDVTKSEEIWEKKLALHNQIIQNSTMIWWIKNNALANWESNCNDLLKNNSTLQWKDDYYLLQLWKNKELTYCDMTTDWGGWTLYTGKWQYHLSDSWLLKVYKNIIDNNEFADIRFIYTTPNAKTFHLLYTPYNFEEWYSILTTPDRISAVNWNNIWHYQNTNDFANAFTVWDNNTTTITQENFRSRIISSNLVRMNAWVDGNGSFTDSMWTAFPYDTDLRDIFWFPSRPYHWVWRLWNETFSSRDYNESWEDGRAITVWIK